MTVKMGQEIMSLKQALNFLCVVRVNLKLCYPDTEQKTCTEQPCVPFLPLVLIMTILKVVASSFGRTRWLLMRRAGHLMWGQLAQRNRGLAVKPFLPFLIPSLRIGKLHLSCVLGRPLACVNLGCPGLGQQAGSSRDCAGDFTVGISVGQLGFLSWLCWASRHRFGHRQWQSPCFSHRTRAGSHVTMEEQC